MKTDPKNEPVKVMFRRFKGEILALFPSLAGTNDIWTCTCYAHIGQHSSADLNGVIRDSKPASPAEYRDLQAELERIGYALKIAKMSTRKDFLSRRTQLETPAK